MIHVLAYILAQVLSMFFYPLFIPTYGIALFCFIAKAPMVWTLIAILGTLTFTCLIPLTAIWIMIRSGQVKDIQISNASERTMPYLYTAIGFGFWTFLMSYVLRAPLFLILVCAGATFALGVITWVNRYWKISAHLTGIGGLVGGIVSYHLAAGSAITWHMLLTLMLASLVMMFARLRLNAHTGAQVSAGWLLGLFSTCLPYSIITYVA